MNQQPTDEPQLHRRLGIYMATAVVVGNVIGSGIFLKPGNIAASSGNFTLIIGVWIGAGLLCMLGGMCFAELGTTFPRAGGIYVYLREAYGRFVAFLFGWTEFGLLRPASVDALAVAFVGSFSLMLNLDTSAFREGILCAALILGMAVVNIIGVVWGGRVQLVMTAIKVGFLGLVACSPFLAAPFVGWMVAPANYSTGVASDLSVGAQIAAVLLAVMWAYDGWHGITPLAEEVRDPQRTIPIALLGGIGVLIALYVAANFAYHGVLSMAEMQAAGDHAAERLLQKVAGPLGQRAMSAVIMCSTFGAINSNLLMAPRITFAMGRDRQFFAVLGKVHATFGTPVVAILATSLMSIGLIAAINLAKQFVHNITLPSSAASLTAKVIQSLRDDSTFDLMTNCFTFSASIFYALAVCGVIVLRIRRPDLHRPFRLIGYPLVPALFVSVYMWFLAQAYRSNPIESRAGVLFMLAGIPVYVFFGRMHRVKRTA